MRLNASSMEKLLDLMVMGVKKQVMSVPSAEDLIDVHFQIPFHCDEV